MKQTCTALVAMILAACVEGSDARAQGLDYDVLVSDVGGHKVVRYESNGTVIDHFIAEGVSPLVECLKFQLHGGTLYVSGENLTDGIFGFDPESGQYDRPLIATGSGGLDDPRDFEWGPDGFLYVCSNGNDRILRFDPVTHAYLEDFVPSGYGGLNGPGSIEFLDQDTMLVTSYYTHSVKQYSLSTGQFLGDLYLYGVPLSLPGPMVHSSDDTFLIGSTGNDSVIEWSETGARVLIASGTGGLDRPTGLCETPDGGLLVVGRTSRAVFLFVRETGVLREVFVPPGYGGLADPSEVILLPKPCPGDFNRDGSVNTHDVLGFLNAWVAGC